MDTGIPVVARRGHPALRGGMLDLETYMAQRHIVLSPGNLWADMIDLKMEEHDICLYWRESSDDDSANQWLRSNLISIYDRMRRPSLGSGLGGQ